ncbi:nitroreductase [Hoyosella altamirensis]|uniref:Nitroreductase n=1 Tax=Hoyosella altamirensis TaxID=616997 RepID=A0A839RPB6_9ACTN|nr:nitroreductase [Hoyosella altamirensis]MBB3038635.1 nitroreductase [Hoyosella altamirensis]
MDVREAVLTRRSTRAFLDKPVQREALERVLETALRAPSGGNLQPWHIHVLTGEPLDRLRSVVLNRLNEGAGGDAPDYAVYPPKLSAPYRDRRFRLGEQLYGALNIPRENKTDRLRWFARNYELFGAPVGLFCYVDRQMGAAQWSDLGMFLQTLMLLLEEEGLASCAQEAWSIYHRSVAEVIKPPDEHMLFCGMAIGYADTADPANAFMAERAPLSEIVQFDGFTP